MTAPDADLPIGYLPPQLNQEDAIRVLSRRRFDTLKRVLFRRPARPVVTANVHLLWMPHYLIDLEIESGKGTAIQQVTLDAWGEVFALWNIQEPPSSGKPDGESFPPRLDVDAAVIKATLALTSTTLHMRGQKGKPHVNRHTAVQLLYYPYWVYYFERRAGRFDLKVIDGAMGERPGNQIKRAILEAFIQQARRDDDTSSAEREQRQH